MQNIPPDRIKTIALFTGGVLLALFIITSSFHAFKGKRMMSLRATNGSQQVIATEEMGRGGDMPFDSFGYDAANKMMIAPSPATPPFGMGGSTINDLDGNPIDQQIIRNGNLNLRVADAESAMNSAREITKKEGGVIQSSSITDTGEQPRTAFATIRIPEDKFDTLIGQLKSLAVVVLFESSDAQDVTMEFIDLDADLRNAKAEEASYLALLDRSGSVADILAVTQQLAYTRQNIERLEGRMRYLENQTDLATLYLEMTEETRVNVPSRTWQPGEILRDALRDLVTSAQGLINIVIRLLVITVGLLLPIGLVAWLIMIPIRKYRMRK